ncbi:DUF2169 family type VI secretion system accessory protein [Parachitinimonas caeni]|uniref:DUF2169 domain-containing protein n=1 Tax=Parachitinimonas caeni TaxID=3031301 RepID=A0ABT7DWU0_9NEIS|nr:DUF2169 domain-containing protein [Parachitinimonas caeni]MDK2124528.1 DUF2169 domain-containing protein [Parachitinimonas caeni]
MSRLDRAAASLRAADLPARRWLNLLCLLSANWLAACTAPQAPPVIKPPVAPATDPWAAPLPLVRNLSGFPVLQSQYPNHDGQPYLSVILKQTYTRTADQSLQLALPQPPLQIDDEMSRNDCTAALIRPGELAPLKLATDVMITGTAHAPQGKPATEWKVGLKMGDDSRNLHLTGPRWWLKDKNNWKLSKPSPMSALPLSYDYAQGRRDAGCGLGSFAHNRTGMGWYTLAERKEAKKLAAPQIEWDEKRVSVIDRFTQLAGFAPVAPNWWARAIYAGAKPCEVPCKKLESDFDFNFYSQANPALRFNFLKGDEAITLEGMSPQGPQVWRLPGDRPHLLLHERAGGQRPQAMRLDTVLIENDRNRLTLIWRAVYLPTPSLVATEVRLLRKEELQASDGAIAGPTRELMEKLKQSLQPGYPGYWWPAI